MEGLSQLMDEIKKKGLAQQHLEGFFHVMIGRRITRQSDGVVLTAGLSWRELAALMKKLRWDPDAVRELGLDPKDLPPRDREKYWYVAIARAKVDSPHAAQCGDRFAAVLREHGYDVGQAPKS